MKVVSKPITADKILTKEDWKLIVEWCQHEKTLALTTFLWETGCKITEALRVSWSDVSPINRKPEYRRVRVVDHESKQREVFVQKSTLDFIKRVWFLEKNPKPLFHSSSKVHHHVTRDIAHKLISRQLR